MNPLSNILRRLRRAKRRYRSKHHRHHSKWRPYLFLGGGLVALLLVGLWLRLESANTQPATEWYDSRSDAVRLVDLPKDDGPHEQYMEWWYYNGHLRTDSGKTFSFHYSIFALRALMKQLVVHVSLLDHETGQRYVAQTRTGGEAGRADENGFRFSFGEWSAAGFNGKDKVKVVADDFAFNLSLQDFSKPVLHGEDGILDLGVAGSSYYYSRPRMKATGFVKIGAEVDYVKGEAWFDHQWGDFYSTALAWDWFALQLEDGADIMLYLLRDKPGNKILYTGTIAYQGATSILSDEEFSVTAEGKWYSPKSRITYPSGWHIQIPSHSIDVHLVPLKKDSEFDALTTTYNLYWEGPAKIQGSHQGNAFVELNGYTPISKK